MRLLSVEAKNFRAFEQAQVQLPADGLVLVAGANNAGKSALLSAFDAIAGSSGDLTSLRHAGSQDPAQVTASFNLTDQERLPIVQMAAAGGMLFDQGAMTDIEFLFEQDENRDGALTLVRLRANLPGFGLQPLAMGLRPTAGGGPHWQAANWMTAQPGQPLPYGDRGEVATRSIDVLLQEPAFRPFGDLLSGWRARFYHFRALRTGTQRTQNLSSEAKLRPAGDNLAGTLLHLRTDRPGLFEQLQRLIADIVPEVGLLQVRTGGGQQRVAFEDSHGDRNLKDLGTGVEQLLMTLVVGLMEAPPFTLLIEEPETNLHPAAQRALLELLKTWADDRLIVAATHSPVMLNWSPGDNHLWHVTREHGTSRVEPVSADPLPLLNALGVQLSDVLSADRVLVVEGPSDEDVLSAWFPQLLVNPRVAVLHGRGGDNARHADQLAAWLTGTDRAGIRRVLYLRDRDELSAEMLAKLTTSQTVHVLKRRELENYLLDPQAIATVIASLTTDSQSAPSAQDIATAIDATAEGLKSNIIINRVARQIAPPEPLMDHKLRRQLAKDGATKDQFSATILGRLLSQGDLQAMIDTAWSKADTEITPLTGDSLLGIAPGEEILNAIFRQFTAQHYNKRRDGLAIAKAMQPPTEISELLTQFMQD